MASATKKGTGETSGQPSLRAAAGHGASSEASKRAKAFARERMKASGRPAPDGR